MSWATVNLITAATVKAKANLAKGAEDRKIDPAIHDAQHALQEILGETLYALVEAADPVANPTLGNADLRTLYDQHIVFFLAFKAKECSMVEMAGEPDRNGVFQKSGDGYSPVDGRMLAELKNVPRSRAENRATEMIRYLKNLDSANAVRVAYDTSVDDEPRTDVLKNTGGISTRVSRWQFPDGVIPEKYRNRDGC